MDNGQTRPSQPALLSAYYRGLNRFRQQKRCYDMLSRQEGRRMRHLANTQNVADQLVETQDIFFFMFGGPVCVSILAIGPLDRVLTCKLIYLLNLQVSGVFILNVSVLRYKFGLLRSKISLHLFGFGTRNNLL